MQIVKGENYNDFIMEIDTTIKSADTDLIKQCREEDDFVYCLWEFISDRNGIYAGQMFVDMMLRNKWFSIIPEDVDDIQEMSEFVDHNDENHIEQIDWLFSEINEIIDENLPVYIGWHEGSISLMYSN